jgi:hypothetical protein
MPSLHTLPTCAILRWLLPSDASKLLVWLMRSANWTSLLVVTFRSYQTGRNGTNASMISLMLTMHPAPCSRMFLDPLLPREESLQISYIPIGTVLCSQKGRRSAVVVSTDPSVLPPGFVNLFRRMPPALTNLACNSSLASQQLKACLSPMVILQMHINSLHLQRNNAMLQMTERTIHSTGSATELTSNPRIGLCLWGGLYKAIRRLVYSGKIWLLVFLKDLNFGFKSTTHERNLYVDWWRVLARLPPSWWLCDCLEELAAAEKLIAVIKGMPLPNLKVLGRRQHMVWAINTTVSTSTRPETTSGSLAKHISPECSRLTIGNGQA